MLSIRGTTVKIFLLLIVVLYVYYIKPIVTVIAFIKDIFHIFLA